MHRVAIITNSIYRNAYLVERSLQASLSQPDVEAVVFVDQNKAPLELNSELLQNPKLKVSHVTISSVSGARNSAKYPHVDWLIFCDDDGYMDANYLENLKRLWRENPEVEIFCGSIKRTDNGDFYSKRHEFGGNMDHFWNTKLLMGSNFVVKRDVFESLGKFDERFGAGAKYGSSEETDFAWNAYFHKKRMKYVPELIVWHIPPFSGSFDLEMKKAFRYGRGKSAMIRKWIFRGHLAPLFELLEMLVVPVVRSIQFLITGKLKESAIQLSALTGRIAGLFLF